MFVRVKKMKRWGYLKHLTILNNCHIIMCDCFKAYLWDVLAFKQKMITCNTTNIAILSRIKFY